MKVLCIGANGWIGSQILKLLEAEGIECFISKSHIDKYSQIGFELDLIKPTHVLLTAGKTGVPNVDWCETHKHETLETNTIGTAVVFSECERRKIHCTYLGTGCIYEYTKEQTPTDKGFSELDEPNFTGSYYSKTRKITDLIAEQYPNTVLCLRMRMPISSDLNPKSFVTKITKYEKVVNVQNSMSILDDLLPCIPQMMIKFVTGIYNFCNPDTLSHNDILDLYIKYVDPNFKYTNFTIEEQSLILKAPRSNCKLDCSKLLSVFPNIPSAKDSIHSVFKKMACSLEK